MWIAVGIDPLTLKVHEVRGIFFSKTSVTNWISTSGDIDINYTVEQIEEP
jgi:hypothetical protein